MDSHVLVWLSACPFVLVFLSMEGAFMVSKKFFFSMGFCEYCMKRKLLEICWQKRKGEVENRTKFSHLFDGRA